MGGAAALLLLLVQIADAAPDAGAAEVVVRGRRLKRPAGVWDLGSDRVMRNCRVFRTSGDPELDGGVCVAPPFPAPSGVVPASVAKPPPALPRALSLAPPSAPAPSPLDWRGHQQGRDGP